MDSRIFQICCDLDAPRIMWRVGAIFLLILLSFAAGSPLQSLAQTPEGQLQDKPASHSSQILKPDPSRHLDSTLPRDEPDLDRVGHVQGKYAVTPVNQILTPLGKQIDFPGTRPQAMALSPDGTVLVISGKLSQLVVVDPKQGKILQQVALPNERQPVPPSAPSSENILNPDREGQVSYTGLIFSPRGDRIYMSNVNGSIKIFSVAPDRTVAPSHTFSLPPANAPRRAAEIPSGLAISGDGKRLFVCGNLSNQLIEIEIETGKVVRSIEVGFAPYDVRLVGHKAYVSNWGGRRPGPKDLTGPAGGRGCVSIRCGILRAKAR